MAFGSTPRRRSSRTSRNASPVNVPMTLSSPLAVSETVPRQPPSQGRSSSTHPSDRSSMKRRLTPTIDPSVNSLELDNGEDEFDDKEDVVLKADGDGGNPTVRARHEEAEVQKDGSSNVLLKTALDEDSIPSTRKFAADDDVANGAPMSRLRKSNGEPKADPREEIKVDGQPQTSPRKGDSRDKGLYQVVAESIAVRGPSSEEAGISASQAPQQSVVRIVSEVDKADERSVSSADAERHDNGELLNDPSHQSQHQRIDDLREATPFHASDLAHTKYAVTDTKSKEERGPLSKRDAKQETKKLPGQASSDNATRGSQDTQSLTKSRPVARPNTNGEDAWTRNQALPRRSGDINEQITPGKSQSGPTTRGQPGEGASSTKSRGVADFTKDGSSTGFGVEREHDDRNVSNKKGAVYETVAQHLELSSGIRSENDVVKTAGDETRPVEAKLTIEKQCSSDATANIYTTEGTMNAASGAIDSNTRMEKEPHEFKRRRQSNVTVECLSSGKKTRMNDDQQGQSTDQEVVKYGSGIQPSPTQLIAKGKEKGIEASFDHGDIKSGPVSKTRSGDGAHEMTTPADSKDKGSSSDLDENGKTSAARIAKDGDTSEPDSNNLRVPVEKGDIRFGKKKQAGYEAALDTKAKETARDGQAHARLRTGMAGSIHLNAAINAADSRDKDGTGNEMMGSTTYDKAVPLPVVSASCHVNDHVAHTCRQGGRRSKPQSHIEKMETLSEKMQRQVERTDVKKPTQTDNRMDNRVTAISDMLVSDSSRRGGTDISKRAEQGGIQRWSENGNEKVTAEDSRHRSNSTRRGGRADTVEALRMAIYVESSKVHFGEGAERLFVEYWERLGMYLSNAKPIPGCRSSLSCHDSNPDAKTVNSGDGIETFLDAFLRTKKMRRLHNKLVCALMKQSVRADVSEAAFRQHIPSKWRCEIRRKRSVKVSKPGLAEVVDPSAVATRGPGRQEIDILSRHENVCDIHKLQADFAIDSGVWATAGHEFVPSPEAALSPGEGLHEQMDQRHETSLPAGCLPGALVIDPLVRDFCAREGLTVSEHAIWLLIVAVRQHATSILKKAANDVQGSYNGSAYARIDTRTIPSTYALDSGDGKDLYRDDVLLSRKRSLITSFDLAQVVADNPLLGGGPSNSSSSRLAWERFVSSTGAKMLSMAPGASHAVQATINRKIEDASFKRRRVDMEQAKVGATSQIPSSPRKGPSVSFELPGTLKASGQATLPPVAGTGPSDGQPREAGVTTEAQQRNVAGARPNEPRGRGRGVKDLSALRSHKAQERKPAPANAGSSLSQRPDHNAKSSRDTSTPTAVAASSSPSQQRPAADIETANASVSAGDVASASARPGSTDGAHTPGADRAVAASPSKKQGDGAEDTNTPSPAQVVRRRGFGGKDLAALRARRVARGGAETPDKNDTS